MSVTRAILSSPRSLGVGLVAVLLVGASVLGGCRSTARAGTSARPVGVGALSPEEVAPEFREDLRAIQEAMHVDPAGPAVVRAADRLLARDPPLGLRLAAVHAKVTHAYLGGDDELALRWAEELLRVSGDDPASLDAAEIATFRDLERLRALLLARSGEPERALVALDRAKRAEAISASDLWAGRAIAHERQGDRVNAAFALAMWRAEAPPGSPEARFADAHIRAHLAGIPRQDLLARAERDPGTAGAACLLRWAGANPAGGAETPDDDPCAPRALRIGALLPRSGPLAALADTQLAAAMAAVEVLAAASPEVEVLWADAGSTAESARRGAEELMAQGVGVVVGPVGAGNVSAAARVLADEAVVVVPGEPPGEATGVIGIAPSLEARIEALVDHVAQSPAGARGIVILAPTHGYGTRATAAARSRPPAAGVPIVGAATYEESTTSFAKVLAPWLPALRKGAALVILDRVARSELLLRQLARDGLQAAKTMILTTAEGLMLAGLGDGRGILEGVWVAPAAWPDPAAAAFIEVYRAREGELPGDQGLLVFRAFERAWSGGGGEPFPATVLRVQGGRIVTPPATISLQPEG